MDDNSQEFATQHVKGAVEALLFVSDKPITLEQLKDSLQTVEADAIRQAIQTLRNEYAERNSGVNIEEIAGGYQVLTQPAYASYIRNFFKTRHKEKLSKPSLETLAIISYKQPVTRAVVYFLKNQQAVTVPLDDFAGIESNVNELQLKLLEFVKSKWVYA